MADSRQRVENMQYEFEASCSVRMDVLNNNHHHHHHKTKQNLMSGYEKRDIEAN